MGNLRLLIFLIASVWRHLPFVAAPIGYLVFAGPVHHGLVMGALFGLSGHLTRRAATGIRLRFFPHKLSHGSARFATMDELAATGLFKPGGVLLGRAHGRMVRYSGHGHLLTFAPTRSGKGVGCVIPNLLSWEKSAIVTDIKGENFAITHAHRRTLGAVYAMAPFAEDGESTRYNPLDFIRICTHYELDDARLIAEMLVVPEHAEVNHWEREARTLITGLLLYIRRQCTVDQRNPAYLRELLMEDQEGFELVIQRMSGSDIDTISRIGRGFSQKEAKERSAVISTAQAATAVFDSEPLAKLTEWSDFDLEELREKTGTLYIIVPPEHLEAYRPFMRLMVGLSMAAMTRRGTSDANQVLFLLDELPALGYMRPIEEGIGYMAGYGAKLWLFVQDLNQLEKVYPKARSMIANCAVRQAFNVQDSGTARLLSDMLGVTTVKVKSQGRSSPLPMNLLPVAFHSGLFETARPLMTPDEVSTLSRDQQLLFVEGLHGMVTRKLRYFDWQEWQLRRRAQ